MNTVPGTLIPPTKVVEEDKFPFPLVGYVCFLEGQRMCGILIHILATSCWMITTNPFDSVIAMKLGTAKGPMCFAGRYAHTIDKHESILYTLL